jgi:hypothetical protein
MAECSRNITLWIYCHLQRLAQLQVYMGLSLGRYASPIVKAENFRTTFRHDGFSGFLVKQVWRYDGLHWYV